ncbi:hypothetical protein ANN_11551 [Periplaneta americana]|uniref:Uncharacterized protein n=1 Tax=Periplaneta americana TaxID=6978 RepID=A0ABQ8T6V4_PERAM|nr:hypothetical protein ANN_11551 [Periplaneta americana]
MDVKTAEFLWNAAKLFPSKSKLQCHYLDSKIIEIVFLPSLVCGVYKIEVINKGLPVFYWMYDKVSGSRCRLIQDDGYVSLPPKAFRNTVMCKFCNNVWMYGKCRVSVASKKLGRKGMKKIIHRQETHEELRPFEKSLIEKYNKDKDNKLVFKCLVCKRKNMLPISKPVKLKPIEVQNENIETPVQKNKKRKKRKDIYAGLNSSVVSAYTPVKEIGKVKKQNSGHMSEPVRGNSVDIHNQNMQHSPQKKKKKKKIASSSQLHAIDTKKGRKEPNHLSQTVTPQGKLQNSSIPNPRTYVRNQLKEVKQQNKASKKRKEIELAESLKNATKKAKRCNALKKILSNSTVTASSPKTTLKDFFASLM